MAVVEVTSFEVREGNESAFQHGVTNALPILMRQSGYIGHEFGASVERPGLFWLIVHWEALEDHTEASASLPRSSFLLARFAHSSPSRRRYHISGPMSVVTEAELILKYVLQPSHEI